MSDTNEWSAEDIKALGTLLSGGGSALGAVSSLTSGILGAIDSTHAQRQARRQANRLKEDETANLNEYLAALNSNDDEYLNALNGTDWDSLYDVSNYGYNADDYNVDDYMDKETNYIIQRVADESTGKSALGGMGHSSGALAEAANAAVAKSDDLRRAARQDAETAKTNAFNQANTLMGNAVNAKSKYLSALESVMNRNDDIAGAKQSGTSSINTNYRQMMANA